MATGTDLKREAAEAVIRRIKEDCQAPFIAREKVGEVTGGAISPRYLANLDIIKKGPEGAFHIGRKKVYPVDSFCNWLIDRLGV